MRMTVARLRLLELVKDDFESQLYELASDYAKILGGRVRGSLENWSVTSEGVSVEFHSSYQGGYDTDVVKLPFDLLEGGDLSKAAAEALARQKEQEAAKEKERVRLAKLSRKRQYEKLKEEFE